MTILHSTFDENRRDEWHWTLILNLLDQVS